MMYYQAAQINEEEKFVEVFKKGVYNNKLRKLLLLLNPPLTTATSKYNDLIAIAINAMLGDPEFLWWLGREPAQ